MENSKKAQAPRLLAETIGRLRRERGMTQETLAKAAGVTFQAVSKWENAQSAPDIMLLPALADLFGVTVDELFGRRAEREIHFDLVDSVPWRDDNVVRAAVYRGRKLVEYTDKPGKTASAARAEAAGRDVD